MAQAQRDTSEHVWWFEGGITKVLQNFKTLCKTLIENIYIYIYVTVLSIKHCLPCNVHKIELFKI